MTKRLKPNISDNKCLCHFLSGTPAPRCLHQGGHRWPGRDLGIHRLPLLTDVQRQVTDGEIDRIRSDTVGRLATDSHSPAFDANARNIGLAFAFVFTSSFITFVILSLAFACSVFIHLFCICSFDLVFDLSTENKGRHITCNLWGVLSLIFPTP